MIMESYVTKKDFERCVKSVAKKFGVSIEKAEAWTKEVMREKNIEIDLPLVEKIRQEQVRAGEQAVIEDLKAKGLI